MQFNSNWIWMDQQDAADRSKPVVVLFRKEFAFADKVKISANCRYKLYVNGVFVQEGPQKGTRETAFVDFAGLETYLCGSENVAAVEVLYYPEAASLRNDSLYYSPFPCLYFEDLSEKKELDGKSGWKYFKAAHIEITGEAFNPAPIHGSEVVTGDGRLKGWMQKGYDACGWKDVRAYNLFEVNKPVAPFHMEDRTIPAMAHEACRFSEVVCIRETSGWEENSLKEQWEKLLRGEESLEIPADTTWTVEISAGEEMCGYPSLRMAGGKDAEIKILYAECYAKPQSKVMTPMGERELPPLKGDRTDYTNGTLLGTEDRYTVAGYGTKEGAETYEPYLFRTFRYICVQITTRSQGLSVLGYDYLSTGYPLEVKHHPVSDKELYNRIWNISLRTLKRCMHETYVDCPFYEQLQYAMDSRAEILFTYEVSEDDRLARACMEAFRKTQREDGILQASAPATEVNVIPGFSIFYILMVHDHMTYFKDRELVKNHLGCVDQILDFFDRSLTEKGLVGRVGGALYRHKYWSFIDWCPEWGNTAGVPMAVNEGDGSLTMESLLYLYGLKKAAELAEFIGRGGVADEYRERSRVLEKAILDHCIGKNGLLQDGPGVEMYSTHCQVWAVLNELIPDSQGKENIKNTYGVSGIPQCSVSMSFYLLLALDKLDMLEEAEGMWDMWKTMLDNQMTTCVENFTDQRSDCHAWGAIMLYALPRIYNR